MARWEDAETYLTGHHNAGTEFSNEDYALDVGLEPWEVTCNLQAYLNEQRSKNSRAKYVLHRKPDTRTRNAKWLVGEKAKDAMQVGDALFSDVKTKIMGAFARDLVQLATINPRAAKRAKHTVDQMVSHMIPLLEAVLVDMDADE